MFYLNPKDKFLFSCSETCFLIAAVCNICSILICFCCRSDKHCPELMDFLRSGITLASVDIRNDKLKMRHNFGIEIPADCLIDPQEEFRLRHERTLMAHMTVALINEEYADMKTKFPKSQHRLWEKTPLDRINIEYAAKDAYVSYELYRKIRVVNYGQSHLE